MNGSERIPLILFTFLYIISLVVYHFYSMVHEDIVALLLLLWCGFVFSRFLQMFELGFAQRQQKSGVEKKYSLPGRLLAQLTRSLSARSREENWHFLSGSFYISVALFGLYILWGSYLSFHPAYPQTYTDIVTGIHSHFYEMIGSPLSSSFLPSLFFYFLKLVFLFTIALIYVALLYLTSHRENARFLLYLCLGAFLISLIYCVGLAPEFIDIFRFLTMPSHDLWYGHGWVLQPMLQKMEIMSHETHSLFQLRLLNIGIPGTVILYSFGLLTLLHFLKGSLIGKPNALYSLTGLLVLIILACFDLFVVYSHAFDGLWVSGWACLAILTILSNQKRKKTYTFYMP